MQGGTSIQELSHGDDNSCSIIFVNNNINLMTIIGTIDNNGRFESNITIKGDGFECQSEALTVFVNDMCESLKKCSSFNKCLLVNAQTAATSCTFHCSCTNCDKLYVQIQRLGWVKMDLSSWEICEVTVTH